MKRLYKKGLLIKIIIIFSFFSIVVGFGYSYLSTKLSISGSVSALLSDGGISIDPDSNPNLSFTSPTSNVWQEGGFYKRHYTFSIQNIGNENYDNYKLTLTFNQNIEGVSIWNDQYEIVSNKVIISNSGVNLLPGSSREISFIVSYRNENISINKIKLEIKTDVEEVDPSDFIITFNQSNSWGAYTYQYNVNVRNNTGNTVTYWQLDITLPPGTTHGGGWNAKFSTLGNILIIKNETYNGTIPNNSSVSFGLQLNTNIQNYIPDDIKISIR